MEKPIITITEGKIQGTTLKSVFGKYYLAFRGIPYAQPPLGNLRFCIPKPPIKWTGIRDGSKFSSIPMQVEKDVCTPPPNPIIGSEDCLYLNVYTNSIGQKRPVMFYIFGGRFAFGNGNEKFQGVDYFMEKDAILVIANYRLGPFGFFNLGHEVASGNQGVRDLILALKWVQRNIKAFGGDPNNVTIFGNSAGSILCHLLTLIPDSSYLFHKAILQSGSCYLAASLHLGELYKNGFKIASILGMDSDDPEKIFEFLQTVPAEDLINLEGQLIDIWDRKVLGYTEYGPIVDAGYIKNPVIPMSINELLHKNDIKIPMIIGNVSNECILYFREYFDNECVYEFYNKHMEELIKNLLNLKDPTKFSEIMKLVLEFYLSNQPIGKDNLWNFSQLLTDLTFIFVNRKIIDQRNEHAIAPTYFYNFSHTGKEMTVFKMKSSRLQGVSHADELSYMFYFDFLQDKNLKQKIFDPKDKLVIERMVNMWYYFAATGNPTPKIDDRVITTNWKPTSKDNLYYLDIGEELVLKNDQDSKSRILYDKIKNGFLSI